MPDIGDVPPRQLVACCANPQYAADLVDELDRTVSHMDELAGVVRR